MESVDSKRDAWLLREFHKADGEAKGFLTASEVTDLTKSLNRYISYSRIKQNLRELDQMKKDSKGRVLADDFVKFFKDLTTRPEIYFILSSYATDQDFLKPDELLLFLEAEQNITGLSLRKCEQLIEKYEPSEDARANMQLSIDGKLPLELRHHTRITGFTSYLLSPECDIFDSSHLQVCQDMGQPLTHYYIASSHKTFLLEDQFRGPSGIEGYQRALMSGCRYIEMEVCDGASGSPVVYRNHTMTNEIPLANVLQTIAEFGFLRSEFPLIISIENHCSARQQLQLASMLANYLGKRLLRANNFHEMVPPETPDNTGGTQWPSPRDLTGKVLLKGRKLPYGSTSATGFVIEEDEFIEKMIRELSDLFFLDSMVFEGPATQGANDTRGLVTAALNAALENSDGCTRSQGPMRKTSRDATAKKPSNDPSNVVMVGGASRRSISMVSSPRNSLTAELSAMPCHPLHVANVSEMQSIRLVNNCAAELVQTSRSRLIRVFPSPARSDSSNQNPFDVWMWGGQLAPLNYQTAGLIMDLVTGFFARNGACGYVLKPLVYRLPLSFFNPTRYYPDSSLPDTLPQVLRLRIISAQQLPKPRGSVVKGDIVEPYVRVEVFGIPVDCAEESTKTVKGVSVSGPGAVFDETFEFNVQLGSLAVVRFLVLDDDGIGDDFIGQNSIPFDCMRQGYRHIRLRSDIGEPIGMATLFVHVSITNQAGGQAENPKPGMLGRLRSRTKNKPALRKLQDPDMQLLFKTATGLLTECHDTRMEVYTAFDAFRRACGENPSSQSMNQCIRGLVSRLVSTSGSSEALAWPIRMRIRTEDALPHLEWCPPSMDNVSLLCDEGANAASSQAADSASIDSVSVLGGYGGGLTRRLSMMSLTSAISSSSVALAATPAARMERLRRTVNLFETFIEASKNVIKRGPFIREKLQQSQNEASEAFFKKCNRMDVKKSEGPHHLTRMLSNDQPEDAASRSKKSSFRSRSQTVKVSGDSDSKFSDNFAWNIRLMTGQLQLLDACVSEVNTWLVQAKEAGAATGLLAGKLKGDGLGVSARGSNSCMVLRRQMSNEGSVNSSNSDSIGGTRSSSTAPYTPLKRLDY